MSNVFFTSDLQLFHARVADLRGFTSNRDHVTAIYEGWSETIRPKDVIWLLGDTGIGTKDLPAALAGLAALPGRKRLILGNHDAGHPRYRDAHRWLRPYAEVFEHVATSATARLQGTDVLLSHFPYERDRGEARHLQWRLPDLGVPLLHGHTHGTERLSTSLRGTPELHVGLDAWGLKPVSDRTLLGLL